MSATERPTGNAGGGLFELAFDRTSAALAVLDADGRLLRLNQSFHSLTGYDAGELDGQDVDILAHGDIGSVRTLVERLCAGETAERRVEACWRRRDASILWVRLSFEVIAREGDVACVVVEAEGLNGRYGEEDRHRLLANNVSDIVSLYGPDGRCEYISPSVERVLGYAPSEMIGRQATYLVPANAYRHGQAASATASGQAQGSSASHLVPMRRKDGVEVCMEISTRRTTGPDGRSLFVAVARDVTDRVERDHRFHLIAENTSDIIATRSLDGRATFVSASCEAIMGWTSAEFASHRPEDIVHPDDIEAVRAVYASVLDGAEGASVRWRARRKGSDDWIWFESRPSLLREAKPGGAPELIDVIRDVTAQVAQEEALAQATVAAQAAAAAKADFLANMSHEIRTPLTAVLGFAGVLTSRPDLSPEAQHLADRIARAGRGLLTIVNDVLDFSKLEAGRFEIRPRPATPLDLVHDVAAMFRTLADGKGLDLSVETDVGADHIASLDPERTRQVLVNLVGNALKFTDEGGVTIRMLRRGDDLGFEVVDTGPGLSPAQCDTLFERFSQVDNSSTRRHGGTGLGLAICRGLVEAMGGRVGVRSTLGAGSCFHFEMPAPPMAADTAAADDETPAVALDGVRLLVADDNPVNRELVKMVLAPFGVEITEARDGFEAVDRAASEVFDLILMDIRMPHLDGVEATARIRGGAGPNAQTPIMAFSAGTEIATGEAEEFDGFIPKPIEVPTLVGAVAAVMAQVEGPRRAVG